jgi:hypothetical protein
MMNCSSMSRTLDIIRDMEELVSFTPAIDPGSWELGSLPKLDKQQARLWSLNDIQQVGVEAYEKDLTRWTRYIPPGITRKYVDQVSKEKSYVTIPITLHSHPKLHFCHRLFSTCQSL